jgi:hypothetical protein
MEDCMQIDLRDDLKAISKYVKQRVRDYPVYENLGPGRDEDPISLITLGFEFDQAGWIALVFDTRPNAQSDGQWNNHIEGNSLERNHWFEAIDDLAERGNPLTITLHEGSRKSIPPDFDAVDVAGCFGEMLRFALLTCRENGVFAKLPTTQDCLLCVEHHEGAFGAIEYLDGRDSEASEEDHEGELLRRVGRLSTRKQIEFWIAELDQRAAGKPSELDNLVLEADVAFDELEAIGEKAVLPLLELAAKWSSHPEFDGDRPKRAIQETPVQDIVIGAVWKVRDIGLASPKVCGLLQDIIRKSVQVNSARKLWGVLPYHAADCLHELFPAYPEPKKHSSTNALLHAEAFTDSPRKTP